jgi:hypothetical protein
VSQVLDPHRCALHDLHHRVLDVLRPPHEARHRRQVQVVVLLHHAGDLDPVVVPDGVYHLRQGQAVGIELLRLDQHVVLGRPAAHDAGFGDAGEAVEARRQVVIRELPEIGQAARRRGDAEADHREDGEGQPVDGEAAARGQRGGDLGDAALDQVQGVQDVHAPAEEDADLRRAARGDGADVGDAWNQADGFLDGPCHRERLDVHGRDAVVDQDHDAGEVGLRQDGDREPERKDRARHGEAHHDQQQGPSVRLDEIPEPRGHGLPSSASRTWVASGRP